MAYDGVTTKAIVEELKIELIGGKINKILNPTKNELILDVYNQKNLKVYVSINSNNYRMHLTKYSKKNPITPYNFCMVLRKHLIGSKIVNIEMIGLERIIKITIDGYNELNDKINKYIYIELMGKHSNIILVNENDKIIDLMRYIDSEKATRELLPARKYILPDQEKLDFTKENFIKVLKDSKKDDTVNLIANNFIGISKVFVNNIVKDSIEKDNHYQYIEEIYNRINLILVGVKNKNVYLKTILNSSGQINDYVVDIKPKDINEDYSINYDLDKFYNNKETNEILISQTNELLRFVKSNMKKYEKRLFNIEKKLKECENKDKYKVYGELLITNMYRLKNENKSEVVLENFYDDNKEIIIPLDNKLSISNNSKKYFKKYNKLKNAETIVSKQKSETEKEINYLDSLIYSIDNVVEIEEVDEIKEEIKENKLFFKKVKENNTKKKSVKKKKETKNYDEIIEKHIVNNYIIYVGKNNLQNDYLTFKLARNNDIWFHTKDIHGSHVVLKLNGEKLNDEILEKCANLAGINSKGKNSNNVAVDYTEIRNVKRVKNGRPGLVFYENYNTIIMKLSDNK